MPDPRVPVLITYSKPTLEIALVTAYDYDGSGNLIYVGKAAPGPIWICLAADNTTATFRAPSSTDLVGSCEIASSFPLPATLTFVGCPAASKRFAIVATIQGGPQN